jgi:3-deoxy-D-manno-octulosonic-acid transferase
LTLFYRVIVGVLRLASPLLSVGDSKLARGMAGRRRAHEVVATWGQALRDPNRPVAWFHAPSVGEGLQAKAVIDALLARAPETQIVFTFFSPSAEALARSIGADVATYLPWDLRSSIAEVLDAIQPDVVVFTKTEVWPVLVSEARARGIPVGIVGATVPEGAGRMRWPARAFLRSTWAALDFASANSDEDRVRLEALGVSPEVLHVLGDPGIDSAATRFESCDLSVAWMAPFRADARPTVVAGSSWPDDERRLLPALGTAREATPDLRVIIAPHEPTPTCVSALRRALERDAWNVRTLSEVESAGSAVGAEAVIVDRVGMLAHLYGLADISYVGGGFHDAGLHSVLEPAAAGTPMVFGPHHQNARAAGDLLECGGARIASNVGELTEVFRTWLRGESARVRSGRSAAGYIEHHRGAAERCAHLLDPLIITDP